MKDLADINLGNQWRAILAIWTSDAWRDSFCNDLTSMSQPSRSGRFRYSHRSSVPVPFV